MTKSIRNEDVRALATIAAELRIDYKNHDGAWDGSPFAWIKTRPSRQIGKIGEQLVAEWCAAKGLNVMRSPDSEADRIIEGQRVEIKFSTLWAGGFYMFQQIRDQNYDTLLCLGISPFDAHAWIIRKTDIPFHRLGHQHGGARGRDTWWIKMNPRTPPSWLGRQRGTLSDIKDFFRGRVR